MTSELEAFIAGKSISTSSRHIQLVTGVEWEYDEWRVTLSYSGREHTTAYKTGLGHRKMAQGVRRERGGYSLYRNAPMRFDLAVRTGLLKPQGPSIANVIGSLCVDVSSANESFEVWGEVFGQSSDSIKALDIYRTCQQTRDALVRLFGHELFDELCSKEH